MAATSLTFNDRVRRLTARHRKFTNGVVGRMGPDGLVTAVARRSLPRFPLRATVLLVGVAFLFKSYMFATLGAVSYDARVAALAQGTTMERAGAWIIQADPATVMIGGWINRLQG